MAAKKSKRKSAGARPKKAKIHLSRIRVNRQGYTSDGHYFGVGAQIFTYEILNADGVWVDRPAFRAKNRVEALRTLRAKPEWAL
jgi:hypothetical protein